jgi:putative transposase
MRRGFLYLVAIMDWASRKVLAWRLSNTIDTEFCIEALEEALGKYGKPEIFNTDQGSQFTSPRSTRILKDANVRISMDGKGRWMDNVFIERLWRSIKYECVYLHAFENGTEARRPHSALAGLTPDEAFAGAARGATTGGLTTTEPSVIPPPGRPTNGGRLRLLEAARRSCLEARVPPPTSGGRSPMDRCPGFNASW